MSEVLSCFCFRLSHGRRACVLVYIMSDKEISPTSFLPHSSVAEVFYEMHCLCEQELTLTMREKNLVSLGYLLYSSPDHVMLITSLRWASPQLIIEVHQLMNLVCSQALLYISEHMQAISAETLSHYDQVARLIQEKTRELKLLYS